MTILEIIQEFCIKNGLNKPKVVFSSNDVHVLQMARIVNDGILDLITTRKQWTVQTREKVHTALNVEDQGDIRTLCPGFISMIPGTIFNRTTRLRVTGPMSPEDWQAAHAITFTSAYANFRFRGNHLLLYPTVEATNEIVWEYNTDALVLDSNSVYKRFFTADTDTFDMDIMILYLWLSWRWRANKGQPYTEEFAEYERYVTTLGARDGTPGLVRLDNTCSHRYPPGIVIPNTWDV